MNSAKRAELIRAKHRQAAGLMAGHGLDCWLIEFARETGLRPDPLAYLVGCTVTWPSAFLLHRDGRTCAVVASGDAGTVEGLGVWDQVRSYVAGPRDELLEVLDSWRPEKIGVTWSASDDTADGISHGMYRLLESLLEGSRHAGKLAPAGALAGQVRARKLPEEVAGIERAIRETEALLARIEAELRPGLTEIDLQRRVHGWVGEAGFGLSWDADMNPMVTFGAPRFLGHRRPGERALAPGQVVHVDFGLLVDGFASDLQRTWYWLRPGETEAPAPVRRTFDAVLAAIDAGVAALLPGARGYQVDAASRDTVAEWDFEEPKFAFGHHVGRVAHDGGGVLGPRWERYGDGPEFEVAAGNVFAVEMDLEVPDGGGLIGLEEEALVTDSGARFMSNPQRKLKLLGP